MGLPQTQFGLDRLSAGQRLEVIGFPWDSRVEVLAVWHGSRNASAWQVRA